MIFLSSQKWKKTAYATPGNLSLARDNMNFKYTVTLDYMQVQNPYTSHHSLSKKGSRQIGKWVNTGKCPVV